MTEITVTVFDDAEAWLEENLEKVSGDRYCPVRPITDLNLEAGDGNPICTYRDFLKKKDFPATLDDHVEALILLVQRVVNELGIGEIESPWELLDPEAWDATVTDVFWQLVMYREVLYG